MVPSTKNEVSFTFCLFPPILLISKDNVIQIHTFDENSGFIQIHEHKFPESSQLSVRRFYLLPEFEDRRRLSEGTSPRRRPNRIFQALLSGGELIPKRRIVLFETPFSNKWCSEVVFDTEVYRVKSLKIGSKESNSREMEVYTSCKSKNLFVKVCKRSKEDESIEFEDGFRAKFAMGDPLIWDVVFSPKDAMSVITILPSESQNTTFDQGHCLIFRKNQQHKLSKAVPLKAHESSISYLKLNQNGSILATASAKGTLIRLWHTKTLKKLLELRRGKTLSQIFSIDFSPSSKLLACTSSSGTLHVFDLSMSNQSEKSIFSSVSNWFGSAISSKGKYHDIPGLTKCAFYDDQTLFVMSESMVCFIFRIDDDPFLKLIGKYQISQNAFP